MEDLINEMDSLFKQVVKYYPLNDEQATRLQWNTLVQQVKNCNTPEDCDHDYIQIQAAVTYLECRKCGNKLI